MATVYTPPTRRPDLVITPLGEDGQHVVKDLRDGAYFRLPAVEAFLLLQLDGQKTTDEICAAFQAKFGEPLTAEEVDGFVDLVKDQGLLQSADTALAPARESEETESSSKPLTPLRLAKKILFWRQSFFDPDRFFGWLAPKIWFVWTLPFFLGSLVTIVLASGVLWTSWTEYAGYLPETLRWETVVLAWLILFVVTLCHEFAHGLTCKYHGSECHEVGFMLMFFLPCFYCNVTDAWMIREKSKRLWVTLAGGYCDMCMWAVATLLWRVLLPGTLPSHIAWLVMSICGGRILINMNPLVKLDGYYLLSDWLEIPNLRQRSLDYMMAHLRWLLWGAARPEAESNGRWLLLFGVLSWSFSMFYVGLMLVGMHQLFLRSFGIAGLLLVVGLGWIILPGMLAGLSEGEFMNMLRLRWNRTLAWGLFIAGIAAMLFLIRLDDWVSGTFKTRATTRAELRAPVSGFLRVVHFDEGQRIGTSSQIGLMEIPDLASRLTQKQAEEREATAKLRLLETGARPEEIAELKLKVKRAQEWRDLARQDLERKQAAFKEELRRIEEQIGQARTQMEYAVGYHDRAKKLVAKKALPLDHFLEAEKQVVLTQGQFASSQALKRERLLIGTLDQENELARRDKDYADAQAALKLLQAGARAEELEAERSRLHRIKEERLFLERQQDKLKLHSSVGGVIITPHLMEKVGQFFKEGDLICEIEEPNSLEIEVPLEEQEVERIKVGVRVDLKPRALPYQTIQAKVSRIAAQATVGKVQSTVTVCCQPDNPTPELIANMTGYARIYGERCCLAQYVGHRVWRYLRTELWW